MQVLLLQQCKKSGPANRAGPYQFKGSDSKSSNPSGRNARLKQNVKKEIDKSPDLTGFYSIMEQKSEALPAV